MSKTKIAAGVKRHSTKRILGTAALALAAVLISGANAKANTVIVTPTNFASSGWSTPDLRVNGTADFSSAQPRDGNGSFALSLSTDNLSKSTLSHLGGDGLSFSDFVGGNGYSLGFDSYKVSGLTSSVVAPAFHLFIGDSSNQLIWEGSYNNLTASSDSWRTFDIKTDKFWARTGSVNYFAANQTKTLSDWLSNQTITGTSTSINFGDGSILGYSVGLGSGWQGSYQDYVDNVKFGTTTTNFENVAAAPEPSQWAGLGFTAFGALGLILKARKKKSAVLAS